ncbi:MAG TPA: MBL fold metallo-hydrolase [Candidatus Lokiarchaeia archaeon]|nr:MBL fold metallo-hydrolase [Candidatus Lokiarchaeia archaeon]
MSRLSHPPRQSRIVYSGDTAIIVPRGSAKTASNIAVVGKDPTVIIDTGRERDPGLQIFSHALKKMQINPDDVKTILITHAHIDHVEGLKQLVKVMPAAITWVCEGDLPSLFHPFWAMNSWKSLFREQNLPRFSFPVFKTLLYILDGTYQSKAIQELKVGIIRDEKSLVNMVGNNIQPIFTPGHSPGHICYLHENGDLFLGDMVPRTPWLDPGKGVLRHHMQSIQCLIDLPSNKVQRAVRSHVNIKEGARVFYPWEEERERFRIHLELINDSLERIPKMLKNRELSIHQLIPYVIVRDKPYLDIMSKVFIDPGASWLAAYLEELQSQGSIHRAIKNGRVVWSA